MSMSSTNPTPRGALGPDPGRTIRCWVALLLRMGIGLSLLGSGLAGYFGSQRPGGGIGVWGQNLSFPALDPFFSALPYIAIGLGLALILGFLTTAAAIASGFFSLLMPIFSIIQIVGAGPSNGFNRGGMWGGDPFFAMMLSMSLPSLLAQAALIWLSPLENHPYSIDTLIFGRNEIEAPPPAPPRSPEVPPEAEDTIRIGD